MSEGGDMKNSDQTQEVDFEEFLNDPEIRTAFEDAQFRSDIIGAITAARKRARQNPSGGCEGNGHDPVGSIRLETVATRISQPCNAMRGRRNPN